jgi:radical SAM PhpK family P-methyltransferase
MATTLDSIIVGTFDYPVSKQAATAQLSSKRDGTYGEFQRNTYKIGEERLDLAQLLNWSVERFTGLASQFNVFEMPSLGAHILADNLMKNGLSAKIVNLLPKQAEYFDDLLSSKPRTVVITTTYYVTPEPIRRVVELVRQRSPETKIIVGGPYIYNASASHSEVELNLLLRHIGADVYVIDSQGEKTLVQVVKQIKGNPLGLAFVPNIAYRESAGKGWCRTPRVAESNKMDELCVDWKRFDSLPFPKVAYMRTARSCPFACAFCNYPAMSGEHVTTSEEPLIAEMRQLQELGAEYLIIVDDTFNVPLPRFKRLLKRMISEGFHFRWISFFRCSNVDTEALDLMAESGCLAVYLGVESGDERILKAMNKYATAEQYRKGMSELHQRGILTFGSFIIGYPGETEESVRNTYAFIEETKPRYYNAQLYFHNPISPIHRRREEFQIEGQHYSWRHRTMDWNEGSYWTNWLLNNVTSSTQLPLYGFSIWSLPYLLVHGFRLDQIERFGRAAQQIMLGGLNGGLEQDESEFAAIRNVLAEWRQGPAFAGAIH